ncbi:hypothetical protein M0R19_01060 [Candidatus Pacearchaeota archaeon]|jgi:hypothetical protein|nr:hypothetical protein [Candidatus Pacearchaeota archaeon]
MPYIKQEARGKWEKIINEVVEIISKSAEDKKDGELNYLITSILKKVYKPSYFNYNRAIGLVECIKQEFYRKSVAPYEEEKIKENGDVE